MKTIISLTFLSLFLLGCEEKPKDSFVIDGKAEGVFNGMRVYLNAVSERGAPVPKDTALIMNEKFSFEGKLEYPQLYYITINGTPGRFPILLENGNSSLNIDKKILKNSKYEGSKSHDAFRTYNENMEDLFKKVNAAQQALSESSFLKDSAIMKKDSEVLDKLNEKFKAYPTSFIEDNLDNFAVLPIFNSQINSRDVDVEKISKLYQNLSSNLKSTPEAQRIGATLERIKIAKEAEKITAIGATSPKFSAPNPYGEILSLDDVVSKGKVTIIDFWAAWCGPCRRENPNVVKVYEKYHDKGLEIIGVGLDGRRGQQSPKDDWIKAIKQDNLTWHQVSNLSYFDDIAKSYNVRAIPAMFVLDNEGKIIAKNLRGAALENKIAELLD